MLKSLLLTAFVGYLTIVFLLYFFQRNLMYLPGSHVGLPADAGLAEMSVVTVRAEDGIETVGWYAPPDAGGDVVVLFHGNAGTIADRAFKARYFLDAGYGVMLAGYRGFGGNPGAPTEQGLYRDAAAALDWLEEQEVSSERLILYGESLGSGVAVQAAHDRQKQGKPVGAVILEAPFTSMSDAAAYHYAWLPARYLVRDRYDSLSKIKQIGAPLLVIHGRADRTVPFELGARLHAAASEPKRAIWLDSAGHVDIFDFDVVDPMLGWLREIRASS